MHADGVIARLASRHEGLVTHEQALAAGLSDDAIAHRVASGRWLRLRRGVYGIGGAPPTERQAVLAACLAAEGVASHLTAARLWGLELPPPDAIEVVGTRRRLDGVRSHRTGSLTEDDVSRLGAIPLTSVARTLVDCSGCVPPWRLGVVVDDALRRRLVTLPALRAVHERVATGPGRRPTVAMRVVLAERAGAYATGESAAEIDLVRQLAAAGLPAPVLGQRVRVGRRTYKLDIAWPEWRLGLEWDSWEFHRSFSSFHADRQRLRRLTAAGWTILPLTSRTDVGEVIAEIVTLRSVSGRSHPA